MTVTDDTSEPPGDDRSIPHNDILYRRLAHSGGELVVVDVYTGERRPSSSAFLPDEDGLSVYRHSLLVKVGLDASAIVRAPANLVVGVTVGDVRSLKLGIRDDPWPEDSGDPEHPRNGAHALIVGWEGLSKGERKRRQQALAKLGSLKFVYPHP